MADYYKEKMRAERYADYIINEILYVKETNIDLRSLELETSMKFACNFMKVFHKRMELYMEGDKRIFHDEKTRVIGIKK